MSLPLWLVDTGLSLRQLSLLDNDVLLFFRVGLDTGTFETNGVSLRTLPALESDHCEDDDTEESLSELALLLDGVAEAALVRLDHGGGRQ